MRKVKATTDADTRRHMTEDGLHPDNPLAGFSPVSKVVEVRRKAEMSQDAFARALHVPVKTIRNWEQGRSKPDPAACALLAIMEDDPVRTVEVIARRIRPISGYPVTGPARYPKIKGKIAGRPSQAVLDAADAAMKTIAETGNALLKKP